MEDTLERVAQEIRACTRCPLHRSRKLAVPGEGPATSALLFVGEAPGFHENEQGRPFVGAAGRFLEELLASIGLERSDVFITNIVRCRPPGNRDPEAEEIEACRPYLDRQIALLQPKVVVTLGRFSMSLFFGPQAAISRIHGQPKRVRGIVCYPMYHPAAALHQPKLRRTLEEDMLRLPALLREQEETEAWPEETEEDPGEQLSLF